MKKFFGTVLILLGLITITASSIAATQIDCKKDNLLLQARTELDYEYRSNLESQQAGVMFALAFGLIIFIIGLVLLITKSKNEKKLEAELKSIKENNTQINTVNKLESLFELKQKGALTEEEFIDAKRKVLK